MDKDVTITVDKTEGDPEIDGDGYSYTEKFNAATLKLNKGWNALYSETVTSGNDTSATATYSVSVKNPDLKWVIYQ
jgi:hypothetical protein